MSFKAHYHWMSQRLSAVLLVFLYPFLLLWFYQQRFLDFEELIVALQDPYAMALIAVSIIVAVYHSILGLQVIIDDYVSSLSLRRIYLLILKGLAFVLCFLAFSFLIKIKMLEISL